MGLVCLYGFLHVQPFQKNGDSKLAIVSCIQKRLVIILPACLFVATPIVIQTLCLRCHITVQPLE